LHRIAKKEEKIDGDLGFGAMGAFSADLE